MSLAGVLLHSGLLLCTNCTPSFSMQRKFLSLLISAINVDQAAYLALVSEISETMLLRSLIFKEIYCIGL